MIKLNNVSFRYTQSNEIISNFSFGVEPGDFICIIGRNGAGKSTLLKLISGILPPTAGKIETSKSVMSYLPQKATLFNQDYPATVEEIVGLDLKKRNRAKIRDALAKVEMDGYLKNRIGRLSGGQQQRVFIAKTLIREPDIIFLDEPTAGIDPSSSADICCLLSELNKRYNLTIIMVTHDIFSIADHANKILCFEENSQKIKILKPEEVFIR